MYLLENLMYLTYTFPEEVSNLLQSISLIFILPYFIAFTGHDFLHAPQRIHSGWFAFFAGSTCILQTFSQTPQPVHLASSTRYRNTETGLNTE